MLLLDEPDNYLDVPGQALAGAAAAGHARRRCCWSATTASCWPRRRRRSPRWSSGAAGNSLWVHGGGFATFARRARRPVRPVRGAAPPLGRAAREAEDPGADVKVKAAYNDGLAGRYQAACTRLAKFEEAGPPQEVPREQQVSMRLRGGRTGKRAIVVTDLELTGLMKPFDAEIWFGDRVAVLGSNGSGKSHFLRLLARGGSDPDVEHRPVESLDVAPVAHTGSARLGARVRPGWFAQTHHHPELMGRTLLEILHRGDEHRDGMGREQAARRLDRYELAPGGRAAVRAALGRSAGADADPAAGAVRGDAAAARRADRQPRHLLRRGAGARARRCSRARSSRSPTTVGSPGRSTASWSSARTAASTRPTSRSGTRVASCGPVIGAESGQLQRAAQAGGDHLLARPPAAAHRSACL